MEIEADTLATSSSVESGDDSSKIGVDMMLTFTAGFANDSSTVRRGAIEGVMITVASLNMSRVVEDWDALL